MVQLSVLLGAAGLAAPPGADPEIGDVEYDSRRCRQGSLFVAVRGFHSDGHDHAAEAISRGAAACVAERPLAVSVPCLLVPDSRVALARLAAAFWGNPSEALTVVGITGTDGKTTTSTLLHGAWRGAGIAAASLTTVDWRTLDEVTPNPTRQTTLEAVELQQQLARLRDLGCSHVALETSSHALELHRVDATSYRAAVYTRITAEHLELHGSLERYLEAKARLIEMVAQRRDGIAVLDATDSFALPRLRQVAVGRTFTYSVDPAVAADLWADSIDATGEGVRFTAHTPWGTTPVRLRLPGSFNAANALAALAAACATGAQLDAAVQGMESLPYVTGRMERVELGQPFGVVVDYAHTAESLATVLRELRPSTTGRLWVVFGSAGERDVEKRPAMGAAAATLADVSVITDEDPREEDRYRILEDIAAGATAAGGRRGETVVVIPERAQAIAFAIGNAAPGDTVLCAGKGHEGSLISGREALPWNERAVAEAAIRARLSVSNAG